MAEKGVPLGLVVGRNAKSLRVNAGVTLEEFAATAREYGLTWSTGRVGDFEAGRVAPTFPTLYAAALALAAATHRPVVMADLFAGDGTTEVNAGLLAELADVRAALTGKPIKSPQHGAIIEADTIVLFGTDLVAQMREGDRKLCKTIGIPLEEAATAMGQLWGRPFTAERDQRAGREANAQRKGQVSRQLQAELKLHLGRS